MRLGARENANQGILLAATTEHFDSIGKSLGRLSVHPVSCADNQNLAFYIISYGFQGIFLQAADLGL